MDKDTGEMPKDMAEDIENFLKEEIKNGSVFSNGYQFNLDRQWFQFNYQKSDNKKSEYALVIYDTLYGPSTTDDIIYKLKSLNLVERLENDDLHIFISGIKLKKSRDIPHK
jgi:hypothetical protein